MKAKSIKDKHPRLGQAKIDKARKVFRIKPEREAVERALDLVIAEDQIDTVLKVIREKGTINQEGFPVTRFRGAFESLAALVV